MHLVITECFIIYPQFEGASTFFPFSTVKYILAYIYMHSMYIFTPRISKLHLNNPRITMKFMFSPNEWFFL